MNFIKSLYKYKSTSLILSVILFIFSPVLFGKHIFSGYYVNFYHYYFMAGQKYLIYDLGLWPNWWPHFFSGYPISLTVDAFLNPIFILAIKFFSVITAYHWLTFLFFIINSLIFYALARDLNLSKNASLVATLSYTFSGIIMRWTDVIVFTTIFPMLPLSFLACLKIFNGEKKYWFIWTGALTYSWIAGFSELMSYYLIATGLFYCYLFYKIYGLPNNILKIKKLISHSFYNLFSPIIISLILISPWLISVLYFIKNNSIRSQGVTTIGGAGMPLTLSHLFHMFHPRLSIFYGDTIPYLKLGDDIDLYIGIFSLILIIFSFFYKSTKNNYRNFFIFLAIFALLMSFNSPLFQILHRLPVLNWFRWHFKWSFLTVFALAILAGYGFDSAKNFFNSRHAKKIIISLWSLFTFIFASVFIFTIFSEKIKQIIINFGLNKYQNGMSLNRSLEYYQNIIEQMANSLVSNLSLTNVWFAFSIFLLLASLIIVTLRYKQKISEKNWEVSAITLTILGVLVWTNFLTGPSTDYLNTAPKTVNFLHENNLYQTLPLTEKDQGTHIPYRIFNYFPDQTVAEIQDEYKVNLQDHNTRLIFNKERLDENINTWFNIDGLFNHEPLGEKQTQSLYFIARAQETLINGQYIDTGNFQDYLNNFSTEKQAQFLGAINVKYIITPLKLNGPWKEVFVSELFEQKIPITIYENPYFKPRWFLAENVIVIKENDGNESYELMRATNDLYHKTIIENNEEPIEQIDATPNVNDTVDLILYTAGKLQIKTNTKNYRWLVFSETKAPFWKAKINNKEVKLYRANSAFQAVIVPPGENKVEFYYPNFWQQTKISYKFFIEKIF